MEPLAVSIPRAGELLGVSRAQAFRLAADGTLPTVRLGPQTRRVPVDGLRRWLAETAETPPTNETPAPTPSALAPSMR